MTAPTVPAAALAPPAIESAERVLRRLEWQVLRRLDGRLQGNHRTAFRGIGVDVNDLREYEPGDDVRHIDWNVTARMDVPFVRQFLEDREVTAWLLLDRSPSMGFGPLQRPKDAVLAELSIAIARLLGRNGNRVGAVLFDRAVTHTLPPRSGRNQTLRLARLLLDPASGAAEPEAVAGGGRRRLRRIGRAPERRRGAPTDLGVLLGAARGMIPRRSVVLVVSDFISEAGWERPLGELAQRHDVVAVRLADPREFSLPDAGVVVFEDAETGEQLVVDTSDPALAQRLRAATDAREDALRQAVARAGVQLVTVSTDDDLVDALVRLVGARRFRAGR